ncbi:hypothetical protein G7046_g5135 [Stylonectria norvegica]|nr:hypothetical protein G7046_g5135 [Stylonectria norvegica]
MSDQKTPRILVIGAGAMGVVVGYHLSLAGAEITYLVRSHRATALDRPQTLYNYNNDQLQVFKDYSFMTDPSAMISAHYDYIFVTLDGASLRNETGKSLVRTIGEAYDLLKCGPCI